MYYSEPIAYRRNWVLGEPGEGRRPSSRGVEYAVGGRAPRAGAGNNRCQRQSRFGPDNQIVPDFPLGSVYDTRGHRLSALPQEQAEAVRHSWRVASACLRAAFSEPGRRDDGAARRADRRRRRRNARDATDGHTASRPFELRPTSCAAGITPGPRRTPRGLDGKPDLTGYWRPLRKPASRVANGQGRTEVHPSVHAARTGARLSSARTTQSIPRRMRPRRNPTAQRQRPAIRSPAHADALATTLPLQHQPSRHHWRGSEIPDHPLPSYFGTPSRSGTTTRWSSRPSACATARRTGSGSTKTAIPRATRPRSSSAGRVRTTTTSASR